MTSSFINCKDNQCNYKIKKFDNLFDECISNECYKYIDIKSINIQSNSCKTSLIILSFTSYKNFILFRNKLKWKISDLFISQSINKDRQLILFIDKLDFDDKPFDHNELIQLGINIDLYILYIKYIENKNYLYQSIHYDSNYPQWNIIKIKFQCLKLSAFDKYPCSNQIISPSLFSLKKPLSLIESTTNLINLLNISFYSSTEKLNEQNKISKNFIFIIIITIIVLLITLLILIFIYIYINRKYSCFHQYLNSTSRFPSKTSLSNNHKNIQKISLSSSISDNIILPEKLFNIDHIDNSYNHREIHSKNNNYDRVTLDNISIIGQQCFVPISSSTNF